MTTSPRRPRTALVLSGGGMRGVLQLGVLRALADAGWSPDLVVGTSAGALNGAAAADRPLGAAVDELERLWASPQARAVFRGSVREVVANIAARRSWLRDGSALRELVASALADSGVRSFADLSIPLHVVTCDLLAGRPVVITEGALEPALVASASIPGLFPPVTIDDRLLVDGGVLENCPLTAAIDAGAERIVAVDVGDDGEAAEMGSWIEVVERSLGLAQRAHFVSDYRRLASTLPITVLSPRPSRHIGLLETLDPMPLARAGAAAAAPVVPALIGADGLLATGLHTIDVVIPAAPSRAARANPAARARTLRQRLHRERGDWIEVTPTR